MIKPLSNPNKKNPLIKSKINQVTPAIRSRAALAMSCHASQGNFVLQVCEDCQSATYPPRDRCPKCWGKLIWKSQKRSAILLAETTIHSTSDLYFREHIPWRIGTILLDAGPTAFAHLHNDIKIGDKLIRLAGIAKGSGMIAPNLATMFSFIFTDADISSVVLNKYLNKVLFNTFNAITVDSDTSTNDMVAIFSTK